MTHDFFGFLLFGPGVRYVPEHVWRSKFFWVALVLMIIGSILYHNYFVRKKNKP